MKFNSSYNGIGDPQVLTAVAKATWYSASESL